VSAERRDCLGVPSWGDSRGDNLPSEINGSHGDAVIMFPIGNLQVADLKLQGGSGDQSRVALLELPSSYTAEPGRLSGEMDSNVPRTFAHLARRHSRGDARSAGFRVCRSTALPPLLRLKQQAVPASLKHSANTIRL
jgi:hypothetical protein